MSDVDLSLNDRSEGEVLESALHELKHNWGVAGSHIVLKIILRRQEEQGRLATEGSGEGRWKLSHFLVHMALLMVAAIEKDCVWVGKLQRIQRQDNLHVLWSAINKISVEKEDILLGREPSDSKYRDNIRQLTMRISDNDNATAVGDRNLVDVGGLLQQTAHSTENSRRIVFVQSFTLGERIQHILRRINYGTIALVSNFPK